MMICYVIGDRVPLLMRNIYLENKNKIGKVDDVFGPMSKPGIAIQPDEGVKAESFKAGAKVSYQVTLIIICYRSMEILINLEKLVSLCQGQPFQRAKDL